MPKIHVEKSITINASAKKVKNIVANFNHWAHWSPWLILEPEAKVKISDNGKKQEWDGKRIGAGMMTILEEKDTAIHYDLTLLKPWKSKSKASFFISAGEKGNTILAWTMDSSLPFFMFFMKNMMVRMIGMDYDRGLLMLKDYIEKGSVEAKLEFPGESNYNGCKFVGIKNECSMDNSGEIMAADFKKLNTFAKANREALTHEFFTVYHKFDINKNQIVYAIGLGVKETQKDLPSGLFNDNLPAARVHTVRHIGPYELSGNAWSAIMSMEKAKEFKQNKNIPPIEFYRNNPENTDPKDLVTDICMAVK